MFRTIVLALDGSEDSQRAIPVAAELARRDGARIVVAHIEQEVAGKGGGPIPVTEDESKPKYAGRPNSCPQRESTRLSRCAT